MPSYTIPYSLYEDRWESLDQAIGETAKFYRDKKQVKHPRRDIILALLDGLKIFADRQFHFFMGFNGGNLVESAEFPPEYALTVTLSRIGHDLGDIQRAAQQRKVGGGTAASQHELDTLNKADLLTWIALQPLFRKKGILVPYQFSGDTRKNDLKLSALTYFDKTLQIRVTPYSNIAVIGIPYSSTKVPMDFLAIPHEVGHFAFWHQDTPEPAKRGLKDRVEFKYRRWWEEIFADVYGGLMAGPVIAFDFQELSLQHSNSEFVSVDDEHPAPYLRPRIYTKVLKAQGNPQWVQMAQELDTRWKNLSNRGELTLRQALDDAIGPDLSLDENKPIDFMIRQALDILKPERFSQQVEWTPKDSPIEDWGKSFEDSQILKILGAASSRPPGLPPLLSVSALATPFKKSDLVMTRSANWSEWVKRRLKVNPDKGKIHVDDWTRVLQSDGWTDGGPQNDPAH